MSLRRAMWVVVICGACDSPTPAVDAGVAGGTARAGGSARAGGNTAGGNTAGGNTAGGNTAGGSTAGGNTAGGNTAGGSTAGGSTAGGNTAGGNTAGGNTAGGGAGGTPDGGFGYALPGPGQGLALGTATAQSARPASFSASEWQYSLFDSYGGGVLVPWYSPGGAYVLAGTGGHNHPDFTGAVLFDFTTGQWTLLEDATGTPARSAPYRVNETTGAPEYEIAVAGTTPNSVPAPPHPYSNLLPLSPTRGGGPRGSVVYAVQSAQCVESVGSLRSHRFDLSTRRWSRFTSNRLSEVLAANDVGPAAPSAFDVTGQRFWQLPTQIHNVQRIAFIDLTEAAPRWQASASWNYPPTWEGTPSVFVDETRRLLVFPARTRLIALDLANLAAGPRLLTFTGTPPDGLDRWELYPADGNYYTKEDTSNVVYRLTPPAGDPFTGTWAFSSFIVQGVTLPEVSAGALSAGARHFTRFFYVPSLGVFAWIANANSPVHLIRPP